MTIDDLCTVQVPDGSSSLAWAQLALGGTSPSTLVVVVPEGRAVVQADAVALHDALAERKLAAVRDARADAFIGLAGALMRAGSPDDVPIDESGALVHRWSPTDGASLVLGGRVFAPAAGCEPAVVVADDAGALASALAADASGDLVRVLRYDGAVDASDEWRAHADEMLDVPFWTPAFCASVVRAAEAVGAFRPHDDDPVPGHEVSLATISPALFDAVEQHVAAGVMPIVHQVWPYVDYHGLRDAFVIKYAPGAQTELRTHHDVAQLSGSVRLNDGYQGCALEFPRQGVDNHALTVGRLLLWPSLVTHPHRATPLVRGVKYALTLWFELPGVTS